MSTTLRIEYEHIIEGKITKSTYKRVSEDNIALSDSVNVLVAFCHHLLKSNVNYSDLIKYSMEQLILLTQCEYVVITSVPHLCKYKCMVSNIPDPKLPPALEDYVHPKNGLFTRAMSHNIVVVCNDINKDPRKTKKCPRDHININKFIGVPLIREDQCIGQILFVNHCKTFERTMDTVSPFLSIFAKILDKIIRLKKGPSYIEITNRSEVSVMKDAFISSISHELRTPLNGIIGIVKMLPSVGKLNEKQKEYLKILGECGYQLLNLLNDLLDYNKLISQKFTLNNEPFDLQKAINNSIKINESKSSEKGIPIHLHIPESIPVLVGDEQRLVQILNNLLSNSLKFTDEGFIDISLQILKLKSYGLDDSQNSCTYDCTANILKQWNLVFTITDTGIGIPIENQSEIFENFNQGGSHWIRKVGGTGLGLAITRQLVELMRGKITVYSEGIIGKGTKFVFNVVMSEYIDPLTIEPQLKKLISKSRIVVVDDRLENRLFLSDLLFKWNCNPAILSSAEECLQYLKHYPDVQIAILDIYMPYMTGVELAQQLRVDYPNIKLIAISSVGISDKHLNLFHAYLTKPIDQNILFPTVLNCLISCENGSYGITQLLKSNKLPRKSKFRILIAEDDKNNAFTILEMLNLLGFNKRRIKLVEDGEQCVTEVKRKRYDLILMDLVMPNMDGYEATRHIKGIKDRPIIVATSALVGKEDREKCAQEGFDNFLPKPIEYERLENLLKNYIRK